METTKDSDLESMTVEQLKAEVIKLREGIRQHRDATGHNLCWYVPELWNLVPDQVEPRPQVPPYDEFIECCRTYRLGIKLLTQEEMDAEKARIVSVVYPEDLIEPIDQ